MTADKNKLEEAYLQLKEVCDNIFINSERRRIQDELTHRKLTETKLSLLKLLETK